MGTVLLTGLEMMRMLALGQCWATALERSRTMEALVLKRSCEVTVSPSSLIDCDSMRIACISHFTYRHGSCQACGGHQQE